jgi:hypothetical protein
MLGVPVPDMDTKTWISGNSRKSGEYSGFAGIVPSSSVPQGYEFSGGIMELGAFSLRPGMRHICLE